MVSFILDMFILLVGLWVEF